MTIEYLQQYSAKVERLGFDENFLDVTELVNDRISKQQGKEESIFGHVYEEKPSVLGTVKPVFNASLKTCLKQSPVLRDHIFKSLKCQTGVNVKVY